MEARWCAAEDAVAHVFVDALEGSCTIGGREGHHLQRVRRLRPGEVVTAADGTGRWRRYEVDAAGAGELQLAATGAVHTEPELAPVVGLALALTKGGLDHVVARCTELGVDHIEPVRTERSMVRWDDARAAGAVARLRTIVREAAAQSRRARLPEVRPVSSLAALTGRPGLVLADRAGVPAGAFPAAGPGGWTVVVGPEGGLSPAEIDALGPSVPRLALGPHVLRAETAPIAVVAAFRAC